MSVTFVLISALICLSLSQNIVSVNPDTIFGSCNTFAIHSDSNVKFDAVASVVTGNIGAAIGTVSGLQTGGNIVATGSTGITSKCANENDAIQATIYNFNNNCTAINKLSITSETLTPGVYCSQANPLVVTGTITLNANGNASAQFFILSSSALQFASTANIVLSGSAALKNVFFVTASSIDIAAGAVINGNLISSSPITIGASTITGRVLSQTNITFTGSSTVVAVFTVATAAPTTAPLGTAAPTRAPTVAPLGTPTSLSSGFFASFALMLISAFFTL